METLYKLYLEISQTTQARNARELNARHLLMRVITHLNHPNPHLSDDSDEKIKQDVHDYLMDDMGSEATVRWYEEQQ